MFKRKESLNFYGLLIQQAQVIRDAVEALCVFCETPTQENGDFVKVKEKEADAVRRELVEDINRTFITPIDREDFYKLTCQLEDCIDSLQGALMRTSMYHVTEAPKAAVAMTAQIVAMGEELKNIFSLLKDIDHNEARLMRHAERLNRMESEVDHIYRQEISRLFSGDEADLLNVIRWKDILGTLEEAADHVETLGNTIKEVTMKYA